MMLPACESLTDCSLILEKKIFVKESYHPWWPFYFPGVSQSLETTNECLDSAGPVASEEIPFSMTYDDGYLRFPTV